MTIALWEPQVAADARRYPVKRILLAVAAAHGLTIDRLRAYLRDRRHSYARHHAVWEIRRRRLDLSLTQVARAVNRSDHTTALNSYRVFAVAVSRGHYVTERAAVAAALETHHD